MLVTLPLILLLWTTGRCNGRNRGKIGAGKAALTGALRRFLLRSRSSFSMKPFNPPGIFAAVRFVNALLGLRDLSPPNDLSGGLRRIIPIRAMVCRVGNGNRRDAVGSLFSGRMENAAHPAVAVDRDGLVLWLC